LGKGETARRGKLVGDRFHVERIITQTTSQNKNFSRNFSIFAAKGRVVGGSGIKEEKDGKDRRFVETSLRRGSERKAGSSFG
jgi:hypothetical protein